MNDTKNIKIPYDDYTIHSFHCHPRRPCSCVQEAIFYGFQLLHLMSKLKIKKLSADQKKISKNHFKKIVYTIAKHGEPTHIEHLRFFLEFADQLKCKEVLFQAISTLLQSKNQ